MTPQHPGTTSTGTAALTRERFTDHTVVALHGELDAASVPHLRERLHTVMRDPGPLVVIDLSGVTFCDSSGLAMLVGARRRTEARGAGVVLAAPDPHLTRLLSMTGLRDAFTVRGSVAEAALRPADDGGSAAA
ncbi:STAS domain-containing protein [Actinomadura fibrosa]|uniref:Anti-sigma factor antagonist n=1 Tax=Actinomadura fibrosa TaxID=111802 RepID=A0ABW2XD85_9ACTN|nr:STAS domain-containing protein [Actinomadura fibrosa]